MSILPPRNNRTLSQLDGDGVGVRAMRNHDLARDESEATTARAAHSHFRREVADSEQEYRRILAERFRTAERFVRNVGQAIWLRL